MTLGEYIQEYLDKHQLSQRQFATQCDLTNGYISILISGANPRTGKPVKPTVDTYMKLANGMGISMNQLFESIDEMPVRLPIQPEEEEELRQIRDDMERKPELRDLYDIQRRFSRTQLKQMKTFIDAMRSSNDYDETDTP